MTPKQARDIAGEKLREASRGGDPSAERHAARNAMSVAEVCDWYLKEAEAERIIGKKGQTD